MLEQLTPYGTGVTVALPYDGAVRETKAALAESGFGILSEIDVAATLHQKLGVDVRPYVILGACNPPLAYRALSAEPDVGLLLPCNVVVRETADPRQCVVSALDPEAALGLTGNAALAPLAASVRARLDEALARVEASAHLAANSAHAANGVNAARAPAAATDAVEEMC